VEKLQKNRKKIIFPKKKFPNLRQEWQADTALQKKKSKIVEKIVDNSTLLW